MIGMPTLIEFNSIKENTDFAKKLGFDFVELNLNLPYVRQDLENGVALDKDIEYTLHFLDEAEFLYEEVTRGYANFLHKFLGHYCGEIKQVNIHLNQGPIQTVSGKKNYLNDIYYDSYIKTLVKNLRIFQAECMLNGANLVIENIKYMPHILKSLKDLMVENFKFTYDVGHDAKENFPLNSFFKDNIISYNEMHLHDVLDGKDHLALGDGSLDINSFYRLMKNKFLLVEVKSKNDLIKSMNYLKQINR